MLKRLLSIGIILCALVLPSVSLAQETNAIKTANYFLLSGLSLNDSSNFQTLAQYDLLVLPAEAQVFNPDFPTQIRAINPDIILLAYVPSVSYNSVWQDLVHAQLYNGIQDSYWLRNTQGQTISIWPGTQALNLTSGWNDYLATFVANNVLNTDYWDGVFYDEVGDSISWTGSDISNQAWINAYTDLFRKTREKVGADKIIISNGTSNLQHAPYVNGRMFESFPTPWESGGNWQEIMRRYLQLEDSVAYDSVIILNSDTNNTYNKNDFRSMRFGLTSTLLGGGFFGFDSGTQSHQELWFYDEYNAFIGEARGEATTLSSGIWQRNFSNGLVLVNPNYTETTVRLDGEYEKLHGSQDTAVNDGSIVSKLTLNAKDGILLLRPLQEIIGGVYFNGAFARVFNGTGQIYRTGFFAYDDQVLGGSQVISVDLTFDNKLDKVVADKNKVMIYNNDGSLRAQFFPYTEKYTGGINIAVGDLENDKSVEIITGTENGGGAQVRIFNANGVLINPGFFAYDSKFRGGVNVAVGDLNGDATREIICGAGVGGGPHVRVFNKDGKLINPGFFAYDEKFRGGVNVASGDINGDKIDEIITGPGAGGGPEIRVYNKDGKQLGKSFFAFDQNERKGVEVSVSDMDGNGIKEIIALTREVFTLSSTQ